MKRISEQRLAACQEMLEERVFFTQTQWPHFRQLLRDIRRLTGDLPSGCRVVSLERGLLYGGVSLLAPFFSAQEFLSIDCSPPSADERGAYNSELLDDPRAIRIATSHRAPVDATGLEAASADLVLVPNLVHHVADQRALWRECARICKQGALLYVFEPLVRELHQIPDDFLRYTPFGLKQVVEAAGFEVERSENEGGPFSVIAYCWSQVLQFFPEEVRKEKEKWFFEEHLPQLLEWDAAFPDNLVRENTSFPMSFSLVARRRGAP